MIHPQSFPRAAIPPCRTRSSASASASPSCGPGNGILRAETGGRFQAQSAGERPEFGSQTATRLTNRPELRGFVSARKQRRFAGTPLYDAVAEFLLFEGRATRSAMDRNGSEELRARRPNHAHQHAALIGPMGPESEPRPRTPRPPALPAPLSVTPSLPFPPVLAPCAARLEAEPRSPRRSDVQQPRQYAQAPRARGGGGGKALSCRWRFFSKRERRWRSTRSLRKRRTVLADLRSHPEWIAEWLPDKGR